MKLGTNWRKLHFDTSDAVYKNIAKYVYRLYELLKCKQY